MVENSAGDRHPFDTDPDTTLMAVKSRRKKFNKDELSAEEIGMQQDFLRINKYVETSC